MRSHRIVFCFICIFWVPLPASPAPQAVVSDTEPQLWAAVKNAVNDSARVGALLALAAEYDHSGQEVKKYGVLDAALNILRTNEDREGQIAALNTYTALHNARGDERYPVYTQSLMQLAAGCRDNKCLAAAHIAKAQGNLYNYQTEEAIKESSLAVNYAAATKDFDLQLRSRLLQADALSQQSDTDGKIVANGIYLKALVEAGEHDDPAALEQCYKHLSQFCYNMGSYDSAVVFKQRELLSAISSRGAHGDELQRLILELAAPMLRNFKAGNCFAHDVPGNALRYRS